MKKLLASAAACALFLGLTACPGPIVPPDAVAVEKAVNRAIIAEGASRLRCPKSSAEKTALQLVRAGFDQRYWIHMDDDQITRLTEARNDTDVRCGL